MDQAVHNSHKPGPDSSHALLTIPTSNNPQRTGTLKIGAAHNVTTEMKSYWSLDKR